MPLPTDFPRLPPRDPRGHKGTFGIVAIIGGCARAPSRMIGAPALAARAALRAGAGLIRLVMPAPILDAAISLAPWSIGLAIPTDPNGDIPPHEAARAVDDALPGAACLVIGPGLGPGPGPETATLRALAQEQTPVVADADAINALASIPQGWRDLRARAVLTPHPGEFKRLAAGMGVKNAFGLDASREDAAAELARRLACVVVLKGAATVVTDGTQTWTNPTANAALATGGTGDALAGLLAALIAQFAAPRHPAPLSLFDAARIAVFAHSAAAERWCAEHTATAGLAPHELADLLPHALEPLRTPPP